MAYTSLKKLEHLSFVLFKSLFVIFTKENTLKKTDVYLGFEVFLYITSVVCLNHVSFHSMKYKKHKKIRRVKSHFSNLYHYTSKY